MILGEIACALYSLWTGTLEIYLCDGVGTRGRWFCFPISSIWDIEDALFVWSCPTWLVVMGLPMGCHGHVSQDRNLFGSRFKCLPFSIMRIAGVSESARPYQVFHLVNCSIKGCLPSFRNRRLSNCSNQKAGVEKGTQTQGGRHKKIIQLFKGEACA